MNKSQRIYFNTGTTGNAGNAGLDKTFQVKLEQDVDTLEFLSLKIGTSDVYQNFNSDYGVLFGRVLANGGIGVENAKISIFIPLSDEDALNKDIYSVYPYKTPRDTNTEGKRYNLLPRVSKKNPVTQQNEPRQAFGSFPIKEEVVANPPFLDAYKKYYKYTALTNESGDYMIFGVPVGTQTVHMSCDITDIGKYSMNPASMITNLGYSPALFTESKTRIKPSTDLGDLPNIETQEITVDIRPFWGDAENFEIGIVRQDFRLRAILTNTFTIFGSAFTDGAETMRGTENDGGGSETKRISDFYMVYPNRWSDTGPSDWEGLVLATKRIGKIKETIYYYPASIPDSQISSADPQDDMMVLDPTQYSVYWRNGDFIFIINCNRDRVVTNNEGEEVPVNYDNPDGVFTTFRGFVTLEYTVDELPMVASSSLEDNQQKARTEPLRVRFKFPQHATPTHSFDYTDGADNTTWRKQHMKFEAQKFYSFSKFHGCVADDFNGDDDKQFWSGGNTANEFFHYDEINKTTTDGRYNIGPIIVGNYSIYTVPTSQKMIPNADIYGSAPRFGSNWLNLSIYFPQMGYAVNTSNNVRDVRAAAFLARQLKSNGQANSTFVVSNNMKIAANQIDTSWFGRSDLHWTDIIEVPLQDIIAMSNTLNKGFTNSNFSSVNILNYRNGSITPPYTEWKGTWSAPCPFGGGTVGGVSGSGSLDTTYYFYKGFDTSDCINFLFDLGLITK